MPSKSLLKIAVFDLNQTVYCKSSKEEFFKYICFRKKQKLANVFQMGWYALLKELSFINKTEFKENFFNYLDNLPPALIEKYATEFWSVEWPDYFHQPLLQRINELKRAGVKVVFITGTLDVYVKALFEKYLVPDYWLATRTQYTGNTYKVVGKACKDEEKISRLNQLLHPQAYLVTEAYSDKEEAILKIAEKPYIVRSGQVIPISAEKILNATSTSVT